MIEKQEKISVGINWAWCSMCEVMLECPKCGNPTCNAAIGEINGEKCDLCMPVYEFHKALIASNMQPPKEYFLQQKSPEQTLLDKIFIKD